MRAATEPRRLVGETRLLVVDRREGALTDSPAHELARFVRPGDLFVVNDAATLPASLEATSETGAPLEVRLVAPVAGSARRWDAVLFGAGDWRTPTERRPPPPALRVGDGLDLGALRARIRAISPLSPRLVVLEVDREGAAFWAALYAIGRPIQYAYAARALRLEEVQTPFASRPWAVEMPSAGRPLSAAVRAGILARGGRIATLTHAAGLSSTGDPALDAAFPFPERYELPASTASAVSAARARGERVIAVGTTVARALEGNVRSYGELRPGEHVTDLVLGPTTTPRIVDGLLTGAHEPGTSHFALLRAFADEALLARIVAASEAAGYLLHEFGDGWWIA